MDRGHSVGRRQPASYSPHGGDNLTASLLKELIDRTSLQGTPDVTKVINNEECKMSENKQIALHELGFVSTQSKLDKNVTLKKGDVKPVHIKYRKKMEKILTGVFSLEDIQKALKYITNFNNAFDNQNTHDSPRTIILEEK